MDNICRYAELRGNIEDNQNSIIPKICPIKSHMCIFQSLSKLPYNFKILH